MRIRYRGIWRNNYMEVTTNAPQQPNAMGGAPTTTQDVNGQIQPRTADQLAAGTSPDQKTAGTPDVSQSAANQQNQTDGGKNPPPAAQTQQPKPHPISRIFDGILKTMTGGPVTYIDANGQKQVAPQSRGTMAKSIVAAALAGLMTPTQYREGAFGTKVEDFGATAAGAAQAGKGVMDAMRNKPQQMSDDEQARKLMVLTSNANNVRNMAASTMQQHQSLQAMVDSSKPLMDSIQAYEKTRVDNNQPQ